MEVESTLNPSQPQPDPHRARVLNQVYDLLRRRAHGDGIVAFRGVIEGTDGLVGAADVEVGGQRGPIAVRCEPTEAEREEL